MLETFSPRTLSSARTLYASRDNCAVAEEREGWPHGAAKTRPASCGHHEPPRQAETGDVHCPYSRSQLLMHKSESLLI
jgi:hypothetical protein